jgi:hypothetical protein
MKTANGHPAQDIVKSLMHWIFDAPPGGMAPSVGVGTLYKRLCQLWDNGHSRGYCRYLDRYMCQKHDTEAGIVIDYQRAGTALEHLNRSLVQLERLRMQGTAEYLDLKHVTNVIESVLRERSEKFGKKGKR